MPERHPLTVYVGPVSSGSQYMPDLLREGIRELTNRGQAPPKRTPFALDNGAYQDWIRKRSFDGDQFMKDVRICTPKHPDFIVIPDKVAAGAESLAISASWVPVLREMGAQTLYLAVQDGMTIHDVETFPYEIDGLFIGGSRPWKYTTAESWIAWAKSRGLPVHIGAVGSTKGLRWARQLGATSVDSNGPLMYRVAFARFVAAVQEPGVPEKKVTWSAKEMARRAPVREQGVYQSSLAQTAKRETNPERLDQMWLSFADPMMRAEIAKNPQISLPLAEHIYRNEPQFRREILSNPQMQQLSLESQTIKRELDRMKRSPQIKGRARVGATEPWLNPDISPDTIIRYLEEGECVEQNPSWDLLCLEDTTLPERLTAMREYTERLAGQVAESAWDTAERDDWAEDYHENQCQDIDLSNQDDYMCDSWARMRGSPLCNTRKRLIERMAQQILCQQLEKRWKENHSEVGRKLRRLPAKARIGSDGKAPNPWLDPEMSREQARSFIRQGIPLMELEENPSWELLTWESPNLMSEIAEVDEFCQKMSDDIATSEWGHVDEPTEWIIDYNKRGMDSLDSIGESEHWVRNAWHAKFNETISPIAWDHITDNARYAFEAILCNYFEYPVGKIGIPIDQFGHPMKSKSDKGVGGRRVALKARVGANSPTKDWDRIPWEQAVLDPECPTDLWWKYAGYDPLRAMASPLYGLLFLEDAARWMKLVGRNRSSLWEISHAKLSSQQREAFWADCVERFLPTYERILPKDKKVRQLIAARRAYAHGKLSEDEFRVLQKKAARNMGPRYKKLKDEKLEAARDILMAANGQPFGDPLSNLNGAICRLSGNSIFSPEGEQEIATEGWWRWNRFLEYLKYAGKLPAGVTIGRTPPAKPKASSVGATDKELRARASDPNTPPGKLKKLASLFPREVYHNPVRPLLELEDPNWWESIVGNKSALQHWFENNLSPEDQRRFVADIAAYVLPLYEKRRPKDLRPRHAIESARLVADNPQSALRLAQMREANEAVSKIWDEMAGDTPARSAASTAFYCSSGEKNGIFSPALMYLRVIEFAVEAIYYTATYHKEPRHQSKAPKEKFQQYVRDRLLYYLLRDEPASIGRRAPVRAKATQSSVGAEGLPTIKKLKNSLYDLAKAAQAQYDEWKPTGSDGDPDLGEGGICNEIADAVVSALAEHGIEGKTFGEYGGDHTWVLVKLQEGVYSLDLPFWVYETGAGYKWKKKMGAHIEPHHFVWECVEKDPSKFDSFED